MNETQKNPYYARSGIFQHWTLQDGMHGCTPVNVAGASLQCKRAPPLLSADIPLKTSTNTSAATAASTKEPFKMLTDIVATVDYLTRQPPAKQATATPVGERPVAIKTIPNSKPVFAFDIQDIPAAMDKMGWKKSAELMRQFFAGRLNYSRSPDDESKGIDQNGKFYAADFVDTNRFSWKWLLGDSRVAPALAQLIMPGYIDSKKETRPGSSAWTSMRNVVLASISAKYSTFMGQIDTLAECSGDIFLLHRKFQFQHTKLSMYGYPKSDIDGSLGNFSIYAAVALATVRRENFKAPTVTVTHVYTYAKDNYSFNDDPSEPSQYLGHWNKEGMIIVPSAAIAQVVPKSLGKLLELNRPENDSITATPWMDGSEFTVQIEDTYKAENVYYPVRNRDFWNWQMQHQRGGNVLSFSDLKLVRLEQAVTFALT